MDVASSYAVGIDKAGRKLFGETERIYRDAVSFLISVYDAEWSVLSQISGKNDRFHAAERLMHTTKKSAARIRTTRFCVLLSDGAEWSEQGLTIDGEVCRSCGRCAQVCKHRGLSRGTLFDPGSRCDECGNCWHVCPEHAVRSKGPEE